MPALVEAVTATAIVDEEAVVACEFELLGLLVDISLLQELAPAKITADKINKVDSFLI